jgi:hypothetical protein
MVILKSSLLKLLTRVSSSYIEVITFKAFTRVPSGYIEVITSKAVNKGV